MSNSIFDPKEITKNLLKGMICENCVFAKQGMCSFGDQMNDWPKEDTCNEWSVRPRWLDDYMEIAKVHDALAAAEKHESFLQRLLTKKHR